MDNPIDHDHAAWVIREYMRIITYEHRHLLTHAERCSIMDGLEDALREAGLVAPEPETIFDDDGDPAVVPAWARRLIDRVDLLSDRIDKVMADLRSRIQY